MQARCAICTQLPQSMQLAPQSLSAASGVHACLLAAKSRICFEALSQKAHELSRPH